MFGTSARASASCANLLCPASRIRSLLDEDERVSGQQPQEAVQESAQMGSLVTLRSPLATSKDLVGLVPGVGERLRTSAPSSGHRHDVLLPGLVWKDRVHRCVVCRTREQMSNGGVQTGIIFGEGPHHFARRAATQLRP